MKIEDVVKKLKKNKDIETIVQFGSSLKSKKYQDIDLCVFSSRKFTLQEQLALRRDIPQLYDISFYDDLPLHIKHEVLTKGKVLYTKNYYKFLKIIQYVDFEYPRYKLFLEAYHRDMIGAL